MEKIVHILPKKHADDITIKDRAIKNPDMFLDEVFSHIHPDSNSGWRALDISNKMGCVLEQRSYITSALYKLYKDGYIKKTDETEVNPKWNSTRYLITFEGRLFLLRGGYVSESKTLKRRKIATNAGIMLQIANAVIIILVAIAAIIYAD